MHPRNQLSRRLFGITIHFNMSISAEAFQLLRSKWEQRERESMIPQLQTMLQVTHRNQRRMEQKENQTLLLKAEAPPQQPLGRLRRLSSLQAITNFTKEAFSRRKTPKSSDPSSQKALTPLKNANSSISPMKMTTPNPKSCTKEKTPQTAIRYEATLAVTPQSVKPAVRVSRSKTTSFLPVISKQLPDIQTHSHIPGPRALQQNVSPTKTSRITTGKQFHAIGVPITTREQRSIFDQPNTQVAPRYQYSLYPKKLDPFFPPSLSEVPTCNELDRSHAPRRHLTRSSTQPSFIMPSDQASSITPKIYSSNGEISLGAENDMPLAYWAGRFTSLQDHMRSRELSGQLPTNAAARSTCESPGNRMTREEQMVREILSQLYSSCDSEDTAMNLKVCWSIYILRLVVQR